MSTPQLSGLTPSEVAKRLCKQPNGAGGLCCKEFTDDFRRVPVKSRQIWNTFGMIQFSLIFHDVADRKEFDKFEDKGVRGNELEDDVKPAIEAGVKYTEEVKKNIKLKDIREMDICQDFYPHL